MDSLSGEKPWSYKNRRKVGSIPTRTEEVSSIVTRTEEVGSIATRTEEVGSILTRKQWENSEENKKKTVIIEWITTIKMVTMYVELPWYCTSYVHGLH